MAVPVMQGGNQVNGANVATGGFAILGNNFSAAGNITINAGPSTEAIARNKCLRSLFVTNPADDREKYISFKGQPIATVFTWIMKTETYRSWVDRSTGSGLLWVSGGPGMGKTMLSIFLTEELEKVVKDKGMVLYYFCEGRDPKRNSPVYVLRGLIYTLVRQKPCLMKHLLPDYEVQDDALFGPDAIEPLWRILVKMTTDPDTGAVYCIIDGLDECAQTSLEHLEHLLKKFTRFYSSRLTGRADPNQLSRGLAQMSLSSPAETTALAFGNDNEPDASGPVFKLALISREDPQCLTRELADFQRLQLGKHAQPSLSTTKPAPAPLISATSSTLNPSVLDSGSVASKVEACEQSNTITTQASNESGYSDSLSFYIQAKIDDLAKSKGYDEQCRKSLMQNLQELGDGTFLWVDMAIEQLGKSTSDTLEQGLPNLPDGTDGMFCLGLLQIPTDVAPTAAFVLRWVAAAFRPLKISELSALLYFVNGQRNGPKLDVVRQAIDCCGNLLDISADEEVKLAHQTAKDFLTSPTSPLLADPRIQQFSVDEKTTHGEIAKISISYLEKSCFVQSWWHLASIETKCWLKKRFEPDPGMLEQYPFIQYAALEWPEHLKQANPGSVDFCSPMFSPGSQLRRNWYKSVWEVIYSWDGEGATFNQLLLHIAAFFDMRELAQVLSLREDFRVRLEKKNSEFMSPLFVAAQRGNSEVFAFLLDHGAKQTWGASGENALQFASRRGHLSIIRVLISRGIDVNEFMVESMAIKTSRAALRHAPKKLITIIASYNDKEDKEFNELYNVDYGANISPLQCALSCGHEEIARLLLEMGANIQHTSSTGWVAIHFAAWAGQPSLIELIRQYNGDARAVTQDGWTLLHCAAWRGRAATVEYLISQGLHIDAISKDTRTALHFAAFRGHEEMARTLIGRGANIEAKTAKGLTPLHLAALEGHDNVLKALLELGANREAVSNSGEKPLKLAKGGHSSTTANLLNTYRPLIVSQRSSPALSPGSSQRPSISSATRSSSISGFSGQSPYLKPSQGYQQIPATHLPHGDHVQSPPILRALSSSSETGITSAPYIHNSLPTTSYQTPTIPYSPQSGTSTPTHSLVNGHCSRPDSIASPLRPVAIPSVPAAKSPIHAAQALSEFPLPSHSATSPPLLTSQSHHHPYSSLPSQQYQQSQQQASSCSQQLAQSPQSPTFGALPSHSLFANHQQPQSSVMNTITPATSLTQQNQNYANFPQQLGGQYTRPPPPPPPQQQYRPQEPQQPQQYQQNQHQYQQPPSIFQGWSPRHTSPPVQQYGSQYSPLQPYWAAPPAPAFAPPPTTPVDGPNKTGLFKGLMSQFKN